MDLHLPTLLSLSAALMVLATLLMAAIGLAQRVYGGYGCWVAAQGLWALGSVMQAGWVPVSAPAVALMHALLLQWPVLLLAGVRRFQGPATPRPWVDPLLLIAAYGAWAWPWWAGAELPARIAAFCAGSALLNAWAAAQALRAAEQQQSAALRALGVFFGVLAGAGIARGGYAWLRGGEAAALPALQAAGAVVNLAASLLVIYLLLLLTSERTERELRESRRRLRYLASIDALTHLPNRRHFRELARRSLERDGRGMGALLMFDVDHFKRINDQQGHAAGDRALKLVARSTREALRPRDVAGRLGGDEFVLLLPRASTADALALARGISDRVRQAAPGLALPAELSLSFGAVEVQPGDTLDQALHRADQALYQAKREGRGRVVSAHGSDEQPQFSPSQRLGLADS